ncbi:MAG: hypothetical protein LC739_08150 [Actinobacteria bacterium]|nr:hypothetical protein [Actinomycetota bacterium]
MNFADAQKVADAVLYEGYALYPYRASSAKNRVRFQWGVLMPPEYCEIDPSERSSNQTQCLIERATEVEVRVRFLHLEERCLERLEAGAGAWVRVDSVDLGDEVLVSWDEAHGENLDISVRDGKVERTLRIDASVAIKEQILPGGDRIKIIRKRRPLVATVSIACEKLPGPHGLRKLTILVRNDSVSSSIARDGALRSALVGCHLLLGSERGHFISLLDPPEWARGYVRECENLGSFPVLLGYEGDDRMMLSSPIILYDHPVIAPESPTSLFDGLEIDEILTLRTMTLTDEEKREARATDPRTAAIIDHVDHLPPEMLDRLHGAIRSLRPLAREPTPDKPWLNPVAPWWDPGADASVSPTTDTVVVTGVSIGRGSRVQLRPRTSGSDAQDMFLAGRVGLVQAVLNDVDGNQHLAVSLEDDPAADLVAFHGRYLYFSPDEVIPLGARA